MAHVQVHADGIELDDPVLVEGLPGIGLVGKIAADHLVNALDMEYYASCHCEGLPRVAVYHADDPGTLPPVRFYADEARDLLVLQSDVPVSPSSASEFAACVTGWLVDNEVFPVYLSGLPNDKGDVPQMYGVATGGGAEVLAEHGIDDPPENGVVSGPTGALLYQAARQGLDGTGLVVEASAQFPDPEAARVLLRKGVGPIAGVEVDTEELVEKAEEISQAREQLAKQMQQADDESSRAQPIRGFQ
ncbi:3-isopropylmalate dehydratase [Halobacteriales archaeon QS_1_68_17]|nr:MAG: 3-isopropylmalate dehydratase [Halobacteriales archaeon QS_1_68_17]